MQALSTSGLRMALNTCVLGALNLCVPLSFISSPFSYGEICSLFKYRGCMLLLIAMIRHHCNGFHNCLQVGASLVGARSPDDRASRKVGTHKDRDPHFSFSILAPRSGGMGVILY